MDRSFSVSVERSDPSDWGLRHENFRLCSTRTLSHLWCAYYRYLLWTLIYFRYLSDQPVPLHTPQPPEIKTLCSTRPSGVGRTDRVGLCDNGTDRDGRHDPDSVSVEKDFRNLVYCRNNPTLFTSPKDVSLDSFLSIKDSLINLKGITRGLYPDLWHK